MEGKRGGYGASDLDCNTCRWMVKKNYATHGKCGLNGKDVYEGSWCSRWLTWSSWRRREKARGQEHQQV